MEKILHSSLAENIRNGGFIYAPGVYDLISAKIADEMNFDAIYMTGYGVVASNLGLPDAGLATYSQMVDRVGTICSQTRTPLMADGDTGYGGLLNVEHTIRGYEKAGAFAIQIEDQQFPKKCGHTPDRPVILLKDMVNKIRVAVDTRDSKDFLIIARTDARTNYGLEEALKRAEAFAEAGADILFVEAPESIDEMEKIARSFDQPLMANMVEGGKTPVLSTGELKKLGYQIAIFPVLGFLSAGQALKSAYQGLQSSGSTSDLSVDLYNFTEFSKLMGFEKVWDFEKKWASADVDDEK